MVGNLLGQQGESIHIINSQRQVVTLSDELSYDVVQLSRVIWVLARWQVGYIQATLAQR